MRPLAIVDYGMGNLRSVQKALERVGQAAEVTGDAERIATAPAVVLPGVGAFGACMQNLSRLGLVEPVCAAIAAGRPFLGICLGMQLLFDESEEFGPVRGLGVLPGRVVLGPRLRIAGVLRHPEHERVGAAAGGHRGRRRRRQGTRAGAHE